MFGDIDRGDDMGVITWLPPPKTNTLYSTKSVDLRMGELCIWLDLKSTNVTITRIKYIIPIYILQYQ